MTLKRIFDGFSRLSLIGMGAGVVVGGFNLTAGPAQEFASRFSDAPEQVVPTPARLEDSLRALAVSANAWKAIGVGDALEERGQNVTSEEMDDVRRIGLTAASRADDPILREFASLEQSGRVEVALGLWSVDDLDSWAGEISALNDRLEGVIADVQVDLMAQGLRKDEASLLARGLLLASSVQARFGESHEISSATLSRYVDEEEAERSVLVQRALNRIDATVGESLAAVMGRAHFVEKPVTVAMEF